MPLVYALSAERIWGPDVLGVQPGTVSLVPQPLMGETVSRATGMKKPGDSGSRSRGSWFLISRQPQLPGTLEGPAQGAFHPEPRSPTGYVQVPGRHVPRSRVHMGWEGTGASEA